MFIVVQTSSHLFLFLICLLFQHFCRVQLVLFYITNGSSFIFLIFICCFINSLRILIKIFASSNSTLICFNLFDLSLESNTILSTCSPLSKPVLKPKRRYISTFSYHTICSFMLNNICFVINFLFQCHIFIIYKRKQILFPITNLFQVIFINYDNIFTFM